MRKYLKINLIIIITLLLSCVTSSKFLKENWKPQTIAIMPFSNDSTDVTIDKLARVFLFNVLKNKGYRLVPIYKVDEILNNLGITEGGQLHLLTQEEIESNFIADTICYGHILEAKRVMLGIYYEKTFHAEFKMISNPSHTIMWAEDRKSSELKLILDPDEMGESFIDEISSDIILKSENSHPLYLHIENVIKEAVSSLPNA